MAYHHYFSQFWQRRFIDRAMSPGREKCVWYCRRDKPHVAIQKGTKRIGGAHDLNATEEFGERIEKTFSEIESRIAQRFTDLDSDAQVLHNDDFRRDVAFFTCVQLFRSPTGLALQQTSFGVGFLNAAADVLDNGSSFTPEQRDELLRNFANIVDTKSSAFQGLFDAACANCNELADGLWILFEASDNGEFIAPDVGAVGLVTPDRKGMEFFLPLSPWKALYIATGDSSTGGKSCSMKLPGSMHSAFNTQVALRCEEFIISSNKTIAEEVMGTVEGATTSTFLPKFSLP